MRRRQFGGLLAAALGLAAGCPGRFETGSPDGTETAATPATATPPSGPAVPAQSITLANPTPEATFVTVVVERDGRTVFAESRELVAGERYVHRNVVAVAGNYDVVVETADGARGSYRWAVDDAVDGLAVTLDRSVDVARAAVCDPDCAVARGGDAAVPLVGDGTGRWYAPAEVVLSNPDHEASQAVDLVVSLDGRAVLDYRYRVPPETRLSVPVTYRSGTYRVVAETDALRVDSEWRVPEEPSRTVDLSTGSVGCGVANTELRLHNRDDESHTLSVAVADGDRTAFAREYALAPGETRSAVPVRQSGRYEVRLGLDGHGQQTGVWWACPPHGPATVRIDATGALTLDQAGLRVSGGSRE